jgi:tRNA A37 threonylcarbamoyladenosine biosynthesis protein TsaE
MKREYLTLSVSQTKNLGKKLARELSNSLPKEKAIIIALEGELGSGKISNPKNIVAIEWAEKVAKLLPKENIVLDFRIKVGKEREIKIKFIS